MKKLAVLALLVAGLDLCSKEAGAADVVAVAESELEAPRIGFAPSVPYPASVRGSGVTGTVVLKVTIDAEGNGRDAVVSQSLGAAFDAAALAYLPAYEFFPARRRGQPVAARITLVVPFSEASSNDAERESPSALPSSSGVEPLVNVLESTPANQKNRVEGTAVEVPPSTLKREDGDEEEESLEFEVRGELNEAVRLEKSADAVTIVRLEEAKRRSSDLAEVLARTPGLIVRRTGGLGSDIRLSINGLWDNAVRTFVDGVPLEMSGFPQNIGAISVNLVGHVEIYRGVVPLRLAADALGGAINLVTDKTFENRISLSYMEGSFGTQRGTALLQYRHPNDFVMRATVYADRARNDYVVDVEVSDERGRLSPAQVPLQNNDFQVFGGDLQLGVVDKAWAKRLIFRGFYSKTEKHYGHNAVMSVPYGEVRAADAIVGGQVLYDVHPSAATRLEHITNLSHRSYDFLDVAEVVYDWYGNPIRARRAPGEIESRPYDQTIWESMVFSRTLFEWTPAEGQVLLFNATPKFTTRTGDERRQTNPNSRDPLTARNDVVSVIGAVGHEWNLLPMTVAKPGQSLRRGVDYRLQNIVNIKSYIYALGAEEPLPGGVFRNRDQVSVNFGVSDALRFAIDEQWSIKASYEYATRLPDSWEVFGNGGLVQANLSLEPEVSHNANLGPLFDVRGTKSGDWVAFANTGFRDSDRLIVLLGNDRFFSYQNVYRALTVFGEGGGSWISPGRYLALDGRISANDTRNQSDEGTFADFKGDLIPNRPPLAASWGARLSFSNLWLKGDRLEPFYQGRYTAGFFRSWESQGLAEYKERIDEQTSHDLGLTYVLETPFTRISNTFEINNLTNEKLFDLFGPQRPGRAFFWKIVGDFY